MWPLSKIGIYARPANENLLETRRDVDANVFNRRPLISEFESVDQRCTADISVEM